MIEITENIKAGDLVYAWFSPQKEKTKKPTENEYRIGFVDENRLKVESTSGDYSMIFDKEIIETWFGNIRKVKK